MLQILLVLTFVSFCYGQTARTYGDVRQCMIGNYTYCQGYCKKWHPSFEDFGKVQTCYEQRSKDFQDCMKQNGVFLSDSEPCYEQGSNRRAPNEVDTELPVAIRCYSRCLKRVRRRCRKGCAIRSPNDREEKLKECRNDDSILDCLESDVANIATTTSP